MLPAVMRTGAYGAYRAKLELVLQKPIHATNQDVHGLIEVGFPASVIKRSEVSGYSNHSRGT